MPSPNLAQSKTKSATINRVERTKSSGGSSEVAYIDLPPDSFWVPKEDEKDWLDRNAVIQRTSSRKLSFSGCQTHHLQQENLTPHRSSLSSNYSSSKAHFIGLPVGLQRSSFPSGHNRQSKGVGSTPAYFLRNRSDPGLKLAMQVTEPASPQVNCLGIVGTKKEKVKKTGLWKSIATVLKTGFNKSHPVSSPESNCDSLVDRNRAGPVDEKPQQPSLAGLMRLKSGRRSSGIFKVKGE